MKEITTQAHMRLMGARLGVLDYLKSRESMMH